MAFGGEHEAVYVDEQIGIVGEEQIEIFKSLGKHETIHSVFKLHGSNILQKKDRIKPDLAIQMQIIASTEWNI